MYGGLAAVDSNHLSSFPRKGGRLLTGLWTVAGSQPGHTFPEPGGTKRSLEDTLAALFEFRRTRAELAGPLRTRHRHGSGP